MFGEVEGTGFEVLDQRFSRCFVGHARVERLWTGARWLEGPAWFAAGRYLLVSDIPNDRMLRYDDTDGSVSVFRQPAGYTNGNTVDLQGRLVSCEHGGRRISRTEFDGSVRILASSYEGRRLNSPNDLVVKGDGSIWFTDPSYGILTDYEGDTAEPEQDGCHVYRLDPEAGTLEKMIDDFEKPNGLAFSPDETLLYVVDSGATHRPGGPRHIRRFEVSPTERPSRAARSLPNATPASSTASVSTGRTEYGPGRPRAWTASTLTAASSARSTFPRPLPTSPSGAASGTACSSAAPPRSMRPMWSPVAAAEGKSG